MSNFKNLNDINSFTHFSDLNIHNISEDILIKMLNKMILIRKAEEKISDNLENGTIKCPCHLAIGQEAIAVAAALSMKDGDKAFGAHRSHAHYLALNDDSFSLFCEVLGRVDGCSKGMGGSMHIIDQNNGFYGSVPIVGATIPIATGAGLSISLKKEKNISISYFGDGACEEGVLHESLNLASVMSLPTVFICENNLFSSHLRIDERQSDLYTSRFAKAHNIESKVLDGNNITELYDYMISEFQAKRESHRPLFIEALTYRWKGHVGYREDEDVGVKRSQDLRKWRDRDPIKLLAAELVKNKILSKEDISNIEQKIIFKVEEDWSKALKSEFPNKSNLNNFVYS
ncbi:MAG: thiamine pyrophosphate-dependent dehydrogenase E1 component subunit alpha [Flavobacteriaceae bacterium]|jgi:TPP-dependent pyruvate/acetoin dehydrogenase alpha subunit|nr:thiamine pyrophosphate-dependent dehydrogenase E1 component subunit alpha [Flavobacteriaceae bacterium]MBT6169128.1 thiamine pyrophosphate-dependent dehydrogenase E1 component subunit alpha [Flavobacteriaceae bacterium]MBT6447802.1 thiamine pyrophosphate-dependent dehydrogenase E1 component subunit alpha [Flavobacteriaceae bacterium]